MGFLLILGKGWEKTLTANSKVGEEEGSRRGINTLWYPAWLRDFRDAGLPSTATWLLLYLWINFRQVLWLDKIETPITAQILVCSQFRWRNSGTNFPWLAKYEGSRSNNFNFFWACPEIVTNKKCFTLAGPWYNCRVPVEVCYKVSPTVHNGFAQKYTTVLLNRTRWARGYRKMEEVLPTSPGRTGPTRQRCRQLRAVYILWLRSCRKAEVQIWITWFQGPAWPMSMDATPGYLDPSPECPAYGIHASWPLRASFTVNVWERQGKDHVRWL